ncbi:hypothetical protein BURK_021825 [Burkholderia sp. SJ98]|nr:hypothetical protein BURK_021825 [Burkholderia sp. SJ98]
MVAPTMQWSEKTVDQASRHRHRAVSFAQCNEDSRNYSDIDKDHSTETRMIFGKRVFTLRSQAA